MKNIQDTLERLNELLPKVKRYLPVLFVCLLLGIYGFLMYRVSSLTAGGPDSSTADSAVQTAKVPHIDPKLISQLQSLQDNSTNVQSLFDQARQNPFQE